MESGLPSGAADILRWVCGDSRRMAMLRAVARLRLPDCWIGAGFVRNLVWDRLHGFAEPTPLTDIDVLYFDRTDRSRSSEQAIEARLRRAIPGEPWSVRNQARMHRRNHDAPYRSTCHALSFWAETPTAVAVGLHHAGLAVIAPFGTRDLMTLTIRPTARFRHKMAVYRDRVGAKNWQARWPDLIVSGKPACPYPALSSIDLRPRKAGVGWVTR